MSFATNPASTLVLPADIGDNWKNCLTWGDANGDGTTDLAIGYAGPDARAQLYLNAGGALQAPAVWTSSASNVWAVGFGNLNGDAYADLAVGESVNGLGDATNQHLYVYTGNVAGLGATPFWKDLASGGAGSQGAPDGISWADFNGDGRPDLTMFCSFAAYCYANSGGALPSTNTLCIWNNGSGKAQHHLLGWADLRGNGGALDLYGKYSVLLDAGAYSPGWYSDETPWIKGVGKFIAQPWVAQYSSFPQFARAADFNGDGTDDLMTDIANMIFLGKSGALPPTMGPSLTNVSLSLGDVIRLPGPCSTQPVTVTAFYSDGSSVDATGSAFFIVEQPDTGLEVARMSNNVLVAVSPSMGGAANLSARFQGMATPKTAVYVDNVYPVRMALRIAPSLPRLAQIGSTLDFTAVALLNNGQTEDVTTQCLWSTAAPAILSLAGNVGIARAAGSAAVTAQCGTLSGIATATVTAAASLTALAVAPSGVAMGIGDYRGLAVMASFSDGTDEPVTSQSTLGIGDASVAAVNPAGVTGLAPGQTTLTAVFGGRSVSIPVVVWGSQSVIDITDVQVNTNHADVAWYSSSPHPTPSFDLMMSTNLLDTNAWSAVTNVATHPSGYQAGRLPLPDSAPAFFRVREHRQ